jgi:hypothetical protein
MALSPAPTGAWGTLRAGARGPVPADGAQLTILWRGASWARFTGAAVHGGASGDAFPEIRVPADEDLEVVLSGVPGVPKGAPLAQRVRVRGGARETVLFDVPPAVAVRITVRRDGEPVPAAGLRGHAWREEPGAEPVSVGDVASGPHAPGEFSLSVVPGRYVVSVAATGFTSTGFARFDVAPPGPVEVSLALESRGTRLRLVLRNANGRPAAAEALWLGRICAPNPEEAWTTIVGTDAAGAVEVGPIPAGPCEVAPFSRSLIRSIEIPDQAFAEMILVLPAAVPEGPRGRVEGRIVGRLGRPPPGGHVVLIGRGEEWGRYGPLSDSFAFDGVPAGDYMLSIPRSLYRDATYLPPISVPARVEGGATTRVRIPVPEQ